MPIQPAFVRSSGTEAEGTATAALIALTAFNGAAIGLMGFLVAALRGDAVLSLVACSGATLCACAWRLHLSDG
jgi:hypothetical protein